MIKHLPLALAIGLMTVHTAPALAQNAPTAATAAQSVAAGKFVEDLAQQAFGVLRDKTLSQEDARSKFRVLLRENFNLDEAGLRLIRRHRAALTPQQLSAYRAALPDFLVNTYSSRLYDFADAKVTVVRTAPRGSRGDVDVFTNIITPGNKPIDAIWTVKANGPRPLIQNLTVAGVNVALTQEADFSAYIEKNGFDALVSFMHQSK